MTASYRLTATAARDVESALEFVASRDGLDRAMKLHDAFSQAFLRLAGRPGLGRVRSELTGESVRWWTVFDWLVLYQPNEVGIDVLTVVHGARELRNLIVGYRGGQTE
ncbi:MAG: type II toxin-antitoxin system RelE/ParE family toxin [Planctomycetes bacterium]|nr:type II toxin-antitoxin system RelE/ParE family toxin [Planctomycetota bacterium]